MASFIPSGTGRRAGGSPRDHRRRPAPTRADDPSPARRRRAARAASRPYDSGREPIEHRLIAALGFLIILRQKIAAIHLDAAVDKTFGSPRKIRVAVEPFAVAAPAPIAKRVAASSAAPGVTASSPRTTGAGPAGPPASPARQTRGSAPPPDRPAAPAGRTSQPRRLCLAVKVTRLRPSAAATASGPTMARRSACRTCCSVIWTRPSSSTSRVGGRRAPVAKPINSAPRSHNSSAGDFWKSGLSHSVKVACSAGIAVRRIGWMRPAMP